MDDSTDEPPLTERERIETDLIRSLIGSYFHIVRESIQDLVPKAIMHLLVNHCKEVFLSGPDLTRLRYYKQDLLQICTGKISLTSFSMRTKI